jgi:hypothetical protein
LSFHRFVVGLLSLHDQVVQILAFLGFLLEFADDGAEIFDVLYEKIKQSAACSRAGIDVSEIIFETPSLYSIRAK